MCWISSMGSCWKRLLAVVAVVVNNDSWWWLLLFLGAENLKSAAREERLGEAVHGDAEVTKGGG